MPLTNLPRPHPGRHHPEHSIRVLGILVHPRVHTGIEPACRRHVDRQVEPVRPHWEQRLSDYLRAAARDSGIAFSPHRRRRELCPAEHGTSVELDARRMLHSQAKETAQKLGRAGGSPEADGLQTLNVGGRINDPAWAPAGPHR